MTKQHPHQMEMLGSQNPIKCKPAQAQTPRKPTQTQTPRNPTQTQTPRIRRIEGSSVAARDTATNFTAVADFQREFTGFHATTVQLVAADRLASELSPVGR